MSIKVNQVIHFYGKQKALDEISFSVGKGEVAGFLGPNGAGKSTLMKIITGYQSPTSGEIEVCGIKVTDYPLEVKRKVGYLAEHNPLYTEMYVKEFLSFIGNMRRIEVNVSKRVDEMVELVGLGREQHKKISALSKGYRQRVGLAQALIHDPEVLILDEPTSGLDPNQLAEIRNLIVETGKNKTILLSTHIMQEVEAICPRVIIIHKGQLVRDEETAKLTRGINLAPSVEVEFGSPVEEKSLLQIPGVSMAKHLKGNIWELLPGTQTDLRPTVFSKSVEMGWTILEIKQKEQKLEEIFRELTQNS